MIKDYTALYRDTEGNEGRLSLKAQDARRAVSGAAELIPLSATLLRVFLDPDWN